MPSAPAEPAIEITYFTDPLCGWSWALEPAWRRLRYEYGSQLRWRYRMGGMLIDWQHFHDPLNAIQSPAQVAPHWYHIKQMTGMPLDESIWREDPPGSSYPACLAFRAAALQGDAVAEDYLRRLREAVLLQRRNIGRWEVLAELAGEQAAAGGEPALDPERFAADLEGATAREAFRDDLKEAQYRGIDRFPALIVRRPGGPGVVLVGYRPYSALCAALAQVAPGIQPVRMAADPDQYAAFWGRSTPREIDEIRPAR